MRKIIPPDIKLLKNRLNDGLTRLTVNCDSLGSLELISGMEPFFPRHGTSPCKERAEGLFYLGE